MSAAPPSGVHQIVLPDGLEVIVVQTPGRTSASMRFVVNAGGASDPHSMKGLAHLLEHLIFHGSYSTTEDAFFDRMRSNGARANAFTTPSSTFYTLDAPRERFGPLVSFFLEMITNPALTMSSLGREKGVVDTEGMLFSGTSAFWVAQQFLFPGVSRGTTVIGTESSRRRINTTDLIDFYRTWYVPTNATVILVGDLDVDEARAMVEAGTRWLPPDGALPPPPSGAPNVPIDETVRASIQATFFGYMLDTDDRSSCVDTARLIELRATAASARAPAVMSGVGVNYVRFFGYDFVLAIAQSTSYEGGALPDVLQELFQGVRDRPISQRERQILRRRAARELEQLWASPSSMADALVETVANPKNDSGQSDIDGVFAAPRLDVVRIQALARKSFTADRRVLLNVTPLKW